NLAIAIIVDAITIAVNGSWIDPCIRIIAVLIVQDIAFRLAAGFYCISGITIAVSICIGIPGHKLIYRSASTDAGFCLVRIIGTVVQIVRNISFRLLAGYERVVRIAEAISICIGIPGKEYGVQNSL